MERLMPVRPHTSPASRRPQRRRSGRRRRATCIAAAALLGSALLGTGVALGPVANAVSTDIVISEVYGGGGNSGATYTHDFVELYNLSDTAVDLAGFQVQYFSASGTSPASTTTLSGTLAPGTFYLVQMAAGAGGTTPLPDPDATGTATMSSSSGRVDLLHGTTLVDRVGYGTATTFEGRAAAPGTSNTTSVSRTSPCTDTDLNSADFTAGAPSPRGSAAGPQECTPIPPVPQGPETIEQIQGAAHLSPYAGKPVDGVEGVVTVVGPNGFWMQSQTPDDDPATSEGVFVFTRGAAVAVGDAVSVDGIVQEFRPGGNGGNDNLTTTEITSPVVTVESEGNTLPDPVVLGVDRTAPPQTIEQGDPGSVEYPSATFDPAVNAIDFYESLEGMLVAVRDAQVVGPTASFGEIPVVPGNLPADAAIRTPRGGVLYSGYDHPNAMRVQLDDALLPTGTMPAANVGDTLPGDTTGVLDYSFSNFKLEVTEPPVVQPGGLQREVTEAAAPNQLAVATFNVENLDPTDPSSKFSRLAEQIVHNLQAPDVLALEEIQDDSGPTDDGTVTSGLTVTRLEDAIVTAGGPRYDACWVDPQDKADGGQPGGNIRSVLMFRTDRGLEFVDRPGANATTATEVVTVDGRPQLTYSPGRIDPANQAWIDSRKPLVGQFRWHGQDVFVVANHFSSKGGDDPLFGRWQQPVRFSEVARHAQARVERAFLDDLLGVDPSAKVVVLGDLNDFEFSQTADLLVGSGATALVDLPRTLPVNERYTYVFEGNSQVLDHILLSRTLALGPGAADGQRPSAYEYDIVHTNAEFVDQDSDHDPQVVRLRPRGR
jgi:predicted extracellular nuclease